MSEPRPWAAWLALTLGAAGCGYDFDAPFRCANGAMDGDETGVDCGGSCGPCSDGGGDGSDGGDGGKTCSNGTKDGDETDTDCGGSCGACGQGKHCAAAMDCAPLTCQAGLCGFAPVPFWYQVTTTGSPPSPRYGAAMAPASDGSLMVFGGLKGLTPSPSDTFRLAGNKWTSFPTSTPPGRYAPSMAYDSTLKKPILFAGEVTGAATAWSWNGATWDAAGSSSTERFTTAMGYDAVGDAMIVFGGWDKSVATLGDLLSRAPSGTWQSLPVKGKIPGKIPGSRGNLGAAFDTARRKLVVVGGEDNMGAIGETWEYDPFTQTFSALAAGPGPRENAAVAYDPLHAVIVVFGGRPSLATMKETWELAAGTWRQIKTGGAVPPGRYGASMAFDAIGHRIILFGGTSGGSNEMNDTWAYTYLATPCAAKTDCGSGHCQDEVCCYTDCAANEACNTVKKPGFCAAITP